MNNLDSFQAQIQTQIKRLDFNKSPTELYEPMKYALTMGGKRIRPMLTMLACDMFGENPEKSFPAALAIEVFHNFTLVHDDIMDVAPLRRGKETVFKKWNQNIGILSGDALLAKAFEILVDSEEEHLKKLVSLLSKVAIEVCEGQQLDMNFEHTKNVTISEYLEMIRLKTAVLTGSALLAGAIVANASKSNQNEIYNFGENLGIAFQIKDDILDVYGDENLFGKKKGGDILTGKKTFLYITAFEIAKGKTLSLLKKYFGNNDLENRLEEVIKIYDQLQVKDIAESKMNLYYNNALQHLNHINTLKKNKIDLFEIAEKLMIREI